MDKDYYNSYKEDRDLILEYHQVSVDDVTRSNIIGIGIDNVTRQQAIVKLIKMIDGGGVHHIISLDPYKLHRIRYNKDLKAISDKADMQLANGAGIGWAAKMLKTPIKERVPLLSFIMDIIRLSEIKEYSIFIVGGRPEITERAFFNIKKSFPNIRIVGRHGGFFNPEREKSVIEAIRKSEANIVFVGLGFPMEDIWIDKIRNEFTKTVFISVSGSIDTISGEVKKAPAFFMERGMEWFYRIMTKPWRIGRFLRVMVFFIHIFFKRLFLKKTPQGQSS